jgi:hypothetical protein
MAQPLHLLVAAALALPLASTLPIRATWTDFPGFTVCSAGDSAMNGFYSQVDASSFQLNTSTFERKNMLFFDAVPLPHMKGPYGWELYSYTLLHKPVTKYIASVKDFVDPPRHGWLVYGNASAPAPFVLKGDVPCQANTQ